MPDPNILADMLKETDKGKESKDWPWVPPFLLDSEEGKELSQEALDHVEECLANLHTSICCIVPQEAATGPAGIFSQMQIAATVKEDFKKLSEAIEALKKGH